MKPNPTPAPYLTRAAPDKRHGSLVVLEWMVLGVLVMVATWAVVVLVRAL